MAEKKVSKGSPKWMATFADMSTLLMTFFVLMLSFANIDVQKFRDLLGSVQNAFGVQTHKRGQYQAVTNEQNSQQLAAVEQQQKQDMAAQLEQTMQELQETENADVSVGENSIRIRIKGQLMFELGKATLLEGAYELLDGIVTAMQNYDYYLLVEGHTDSLKISTFCFPSNWELSGARASAVVRYLIEKGIEPRRLSGIGHAYNYPIASNKTPEGRELNRRVEFIFTRTPFRNLIE
ncbi:OmpA family protein [candidate division KSB1 bacterium]|nr:OmpA family protein [candidate division KSB1 bacterium]